MQLQHISLKESQLDLEKLLLTPEVFWISKLGTLSLRRLHEELDLKRFCSSLDFICS